MIIIQSLATSKIFSEYNCNGTLSPSGIKDNWKINVSVARMNNAHILAEIIKIRDGFKECYILSKEDVSNIIEHLTII